MVDTLVAHVAIGSALAAAVVAAWAVGTLHRIRQAAERELAVLAERQRIAREMHDVVAHSLAVVIAQADGGRYVPGNAVAALGAISAHARQALGETRRILGVLRADQQSLEPALGLADLATLVDGLEASLTMDDLEVEPGVGLAAYRIVQEGLTNVLKHAGPGARAEVTVRRTAGWLEILVADDGRGPGDGAGGLGLIGMRERAAAYGGSVELTARAGGGSLLMARMSL
ncbi:hypothetical protein GCM10009534_14790 [Kribbella sandramycini]|nr:histidine kinase [Kribbella sandramycini]